MYVLEAQRKEGREEEKMEGDVRHALNNDDTLFLLLCTRCSTLVFKLNASGSVHFVEE